MAETPKDQLLAIQNHQTVSVVVQSVRGVVEVLHCSIGINNPEAQAQLAKKIAGISAGEDPDIFEAILTEVLPELLGFSAGVDKNRAFVSGPSLQDGFDTAITVRFPPKKGEDAVKDIGAKGDV